jgi:hypothetical protein
LLRGLNLRLKGVGKGHNILGMAVNDQKLLMRAIGDTYSIANFFSRNVPNYDNF